MICTFFNISSQTLMFFLMKTLSDANIFPPATFYNNEPCEMIICFYYICEIKKLPYMKSLLVAILFPSIFLFTSCTSSDIIPEEDMVMILVKTFITDATTISPHMGQPISKKDTINYYAQAYESLGYTEETFEKSLEYYASNPEVLNEILDKAISELGKKETELGPKTAEGNTDTSSDPIPNLWTDKNMWYLPEDGKQHAINFKIPVVGTGIYIISAEVKVFSDDESKNPRMTSFLYFDDGSQHGSRTSIKNKMYLKDGQSRVVTIENILTDTQVTHIMGWVMDHSGQDGEWSKHAEVSNITLRYMPLPASFDKKKSIITKPLKNEK